MTEYELYDLLNSSQQTLATISVAIVSQQTAFAVAMHLVGQKLKAPVFWILLACYSLYLYGPINGFMACRLRFGGLVQQFQELHGVSEPPSLFANYINVSVFIIIWGITVVYAVSVRSQKSDDSSPNFSTNRI